MITGDYPVTASKIGREIGLESPDVVITGRASHYGRPIGFTAIQFAPVLAVAALLPPETVTLAGLEGAAIDILYVGLLSSALTFTLLTVALRHTPPSEAVIIASLETLFAAAAAYIILGAAWRHRPGAALILPLSCSCSCRRIGARWRWNRARAACPAAAPSVLGWCPHGSDRHVPSWLCRRSGGDGGRPGLARWASSRRIMELERRLPPAWPTSPHHGVIPARRASQYPAAAASGAAPTGSAIRCA
jgi:hypothetical protein